MKKFFIAIFILYFIFHNIYLNKAWADTCSSCSSDLVGARSARGVCHEFATYSYKSRTQTITYCDSGCNPPSSYWGCPPPDSICDNGYIGFRTYSGNSTNTQTNYYCPGTSCSVACTPNSAAGCNNSCYLDIGLKIFDGSSIVKIAIEPGAATSKLRIAKGGTIYGIVLVDPADAMASKMRINTSAGIKALRKLP